MFKKYLNDLPISEKFKRDVFWNVGSLFILGIAGIIMNILIARFYNAEILGIFNQVYAIYILASQLAAGSLHLSIQKHLAEYASKKKTCDQIISSGLVMTFILAVAVAIIIFFLEKYFGLILKSPAVSIGLNYALPGLIFFALNKSLMAILNGLRLMKIYAFSQTLRYIFMVLFLIVAIILHLPGEKLAFIFSGAEICLFVWLITTCFRLFHFAPPHTWSNWPKRHLIFGYKSLLGNILLDVNTRVDVLILGYFADDRIVGVYSFAAILAEGFSQILVVLKTNVNPILAKLAGEKKILTLKNTVHKGIKLTYFFSAILGILAIFLYPIILKLLIPGKDFSGSWPVFTILIAGMVLSSGYLTFQMLLAQVGFPGLYTSLMMIIFLSNVILNILLIPLLGMYGSALATSLSFLISIAFLKIFTYRTIKIKI